MQGLAGGDPYAKELAGTGDFEQFRRAGINLLPNCGFERHVRCADRCIKSSLYSLRSQRKGRRAIRTSDGANANCSAGGPGAVNFTAQKIRLSYKLRSVGSSG